MILSAKRIKKTFRHPEPLEILSDISLDISAGESIAITGRSGEGKTTLLHILGTLEPFDSGSLTLMNQPATPLLRNKHLGFIFQSYNLLDDFTAIENVLMPARIARLPLDLNHGLSLLDLVGLKSRAHYPAKLLSGGERQRVAIARALCNDPDILFADEPSGNLDRANAEAISTLLFDLVHQKQKALLLVTHDESLASRCHRRLHLSSGTLR